MPEINDFSLDLLENIDVYLGLLPALAALQENHNDTNVHIFDVNRFIIKMRQFMAIEESCYGVDKDQNIQMLEQITNPDKLMFERAINTSNIQDLPSQVFSKLIDRGYFTSYKKQSDKKYKVSKGNMDRQPRCVAYLKEPLGIETNGDVGDADFTHPKTINNEYKFKKRTSHTMNLNSSLIDDNIMHFAKTKNPNLKENNTFADQYKLILTRSLIGAIRPYPGQTVIYVMCHFKTKSEQSLEKTSRELDHFISFGLRHDDNMRPILNQCAQMSSPRSKDCHIRKLLARPYESPRDVCAIFFVTFLNEINSGPQDRIPLRNFRRIAQRNLKNKWEFYMKRTEIYKFALQKMEETKH